MLRVLQLANGYLQSDLYARMFEKMNHVGIVSEVYVPLANGSELPVGVPENIHISRNYSQLDRILFFKKQTHLIHDLLPYVRQVDVIHAHTLFSAGYAAWKLHEQYGVPYIVAVRNTDVNVFFKYMLHLRHTGIRIMQDAYRVIFLSPAYREFTLNLYIPKSLRQEIYEKSLVVPNGIDDFFLTNRPDPREKVSSPLSLLYVGEVNSNKNLELTVDAVRLLRQQGMNVKLTVVGNILEEKYCKLIDQTSFLSYFPRCHKEEVVEHLRQSDIFVMPSHTETFGLVYAEAMSQGVPVLYTSGQGFDGQFPNGTVGYAVSDTDSAGLAERIRQVIAEYPRLSANCLANVSRFDWHRIAEEYRNIYWDAKREKRVTP